MSRLQSGSVVHPVTGHGDNFTLFEQLLSDPQLVLGRDPGVYRHLLHQMKQVFVTHHFDFFAGENVAHRPLGPGSLDQRGKQIFDQFNEFGIAHGLDVLTGNAVRLMCAEARADGQYPNHFLQKRQELVISQSIHRPGSQVFNLFLLWGDAQLSGDGQSCNRVITSDHHHPDARLVTAHHRFDSLIAGQVDHSLQAGKNQTALQVLHDKVGVLYGDFLVGHTQHAQTFPSETVGHSGDFLPDPEPALAAELQEFFRGALDKHQVAVAASVQRGHIAAVRFEGDNGQLRKLLPLLLQG